MGYRFYAWMEDVKWSVTGPEIVVRETTTNKQGKTYPQTRRFTPCRCECGFEKMVRSQGDGGLESQMCNQCKESVGHGHWANGKPSRTYKSWESMRQRCYNPKASNYHLYGALGVIVCKRWKNSFEAFLEDMGERPEDTTLDRHPDSNGIYSPSNCRWASPKQQTRNRKKTKVVMFRGKERLLCELAEEFGLSIPAVYMRVKIGWDIERALSTPIQGKFRPKSAKSI